MRDSGRPVAWDRLSRRLMPGYGSVSKVARRSSTCSLEKLVRFLRLALRAELPPEARGRASSEGGRGGGGEAGDRDQVQGQKHTPNGTPPKKEGRSEKWLRATLRNP